MVESYNFLNGTQTDINRRLLRKIIALEAKVAELESAIASLDDG